MNVSEELKELARNQKISQLCDEWYDGWGNPTKEGLVDKYINGQDFCIENDFPTNEYIKEHFGEIAERKGVFTDNKHVDLHNPPIVILNGDSEATILINEFHTCDIYVKHNSKANIMIDEYAKAFIRVFGNAEVTVSSNGYSKSFVYQYGGSVSKSGNVVVREK